MEQKQREKIARILAIVLAPLLIYLVVINLAKVGKKSPPPAPAATIMGPAGANVVPSPVQPPTQPLALVDPKISAEQKRIAALLPENNPFNPSRPIVNDPPPIITAHEITASPDAPAPPVTTASPAPTDSGIKLTAIVSRQGSAARMAMLNGRFLGEGAQVAGWTISKVNIRDVLLTNGERQMVLRLK